MRLKTFWRVTQAAAWGWWNDNCLRLAASLAFYTALSLAPLVIIVVGLAGVVTERQQVVRQLATQSERLLGPAGRQVVDVHSHHHRAPRRHAGRPHRPRDPPPRRHRRLWGAPGRAQPHLGSKA